MVHQEQYLTDSKQECQVNVKHETQSFPNIPDKIYFRIGEVSQLVGVDTHVLRYWESEFSLIKPFRGPSKQRLYRRRDVKNLLRIKYLLHEEGYTISGARKYIKRLTDRGYDLAKMRWGDPDSTPDTLLFEIKQELQVILEKLERGKKTDS